MASREERKLRREERRRRWSAWQNEDRTPVTLCTGASFDDSVYDISENRYRTLIAKGIVCYLLSAGGIGAYLTAMDIDFSHVFLNIVLLATAIVCATLYHSWRSENLGYLVFFIFFAAFMILFRDYINSGFYAVVNDTIEWASIYFDTEGLQYYNERVSNRYVAVTIAMSVMGTALNVLLNNYILRRARYMVAIMLCVTVNIIAFYMLREPDAIYSVMLLAGVVMTYIMKSGNHYLLSRRDHVLERSRHGLSYALDFKSLVQGLAGVLVLVLITVCTVTALYPKDFYNQSRETSDMKAASTDLMQNFIMNGIYGIINYYPNNGGLSTGELGGVSNITLDYETDLTVQYTPYSYEMLYIKNFTGTTYLPYANRWIVDDSIDKTTLYNEEEYETLSDKYEAGEDYTARGLMTITNVEAPVQSYSPYYSGQASAETVTLGCTVTYTYYPIFTGVSDESAAGAGDGTASSVDEASMVSSGADDGSNAAAEDTGSYDDASEDGSDDSASSEGKNVGSVSQEDIDAAVMSDDGLMLGPNAAPDGVDDIYVGIPYQNYSVVENFIKEAGITGDTDEEIIRAVKDYFQDNIPYTIRPGATPWRSDFINYFLTDNQKGYCAHFASAATMIFRYFGIPARYCEGYAISLSQIYTSGEIVDVDYENYYDGYSELGETAVVTVDATDADAHAWVEVYLEDTGWTRVEVTPSAGLDDDDEDDESFWNAFRNIFGDGDEDMSDTNPGDGVDFTGFSISDSAVSTFMYIVVILAAVMVIIFIIRRMMPEIRYRVAYTRADASGRTVLAYDRFVRRRSRRDTGLSKCVNYREQVEYLTYGKTEETVRTAAGLVEAAEKHATENYIPDAIIDILERAAFSREGITEAEEKQVSEFIEMVRHDKSLFDYR